MRSSCSTPNDRPAPAARRYWNETGPEYAAETHILTDDFHYGPLVPGDRTLGLLPTEVTGLRCLEAGCGAGQNSIYLASRGARCVAMDIAEFQLEAGRSLEKQLGCTVDWLQSDLAALPFRKGTCFDLVHSSYALPFVPDAEAAVRALATLVAPGGRLLLSTAHPVSAGEWLDLEDDQQSGVFLTDYFQPPVENRSAEDGSVVTCRAVPLSDMFAWLTAAGLHVSAFLEPRPLPVNDMSRSDIEATVPYWSDAWLELYPDLARVPFVAVFAADRPHPRLEHQQKTLKR
jgi:SAM-dependent methyltransferase